MSEIDLTLLTDEERARWNAIAFHVTNDTAGVLEQHIRGVYRSLIAARAENKQKDEALRLALPVLEYIKNNGWDEAPPLFWPHDEHAALEKVRDALLQSEKENEA